jgi:hypothetical protein
MVQNGEWGRNPELYAAAWLYGVNITIYSQEYTNTNGMLVKNPPPAPGSLFLGVAIRSVSGRDLTRVPKPNSISGKPMSRQQPAIFKKQFGGSNIAKQKPREQLEFSKINFKF